MAKGKNTKRALLTSVLSMLLCCAMLVGSTFAWFTDSVTSGKNKIVAGNLDVELEYSFDGENWETVTETTDLFKSADETLWEPGHTEYAYLRVRNAGKLALKYKFDIKVFGDEEGHEENTYTNADGKPFKLSDYLVFNQTQGAAEIGKREDLWLDSAAEEAAMGKLSGLGGNGVLLPEKSEVMTLAVYMPTSIGNDANQLTSARETEGEPTIYLALNLTATQTPHEEDSFGNTYDEGLSLERIENIDKLIAEGYKPVNSLEDLKNVTGTKIFLNNDITTSANWNVTSAEITEIDLNGYSFNTKVVVENGTNLTITDSLGGGSIDKVDVKKGTLTLENCILTNYMNVAGGSELIIKGGQCTTTINTAAMESTAPKITIEDGEFSGGDYDMLFLGMNSILVINGGKFSGKSTFWNTIGSDANITISGGSFENFGFIGVAPNTQFTIEDGTFTNLGTFRLRGGNEITINGGTFTGTLEFSIQNPNEASEINVTINGGDYSQANFSNNFGNEQNIIIYSGLFNFDPSTATGVKLGDDSGDTYVSDNGNGTWSVATLNEGGMDDPF